MPNIEKDRSHLTPEEQQRLKTYKPASGMGPGGSTMQDRLKAQRLYREGKLSGSGVHKELVDRINKYVSDSPPERFDFSPNPDAKEVEKRRLKNFKRTEKRHIKNKALGDKIESGLRREMAKPHGSFSNVRREFGINKELIDRIDSFIKKSKDRGTLTQRQKWEARQMELAKTPENQKKWEKNKIQQYQPD
jgi:hypothetical protein